MLAEADGARQVTLLATGSEVAIAMDARDALAADGHRAPRSSRCRAGSCSSARTRPIALCSARAPRVGVEAAVRFGWDRWLGERRRFVGMHGFGASAPIEALYPHFGITAEAVAAAAKSLVVR